MQDRLVTRQLPSSLILTVADSCELSKASAASCAMCKSHREQPADHQTVAVVDDRIGTLHMKQRLLLIVPM